MISIVKIYHNVFDEKYKALGFLKKGTTFFRLNGDIFQSFNLKKYTRVPECTIEFGVFPLCHSTPIYLDCGGYELDCFHVYNIHRAEDILWRYAPSSEDSITQAMQSMSESIQNHVIPFFDKCNDCASTFNQLYELEKLFEVNRLKRLELVGSIDRAEPFEFRISFNNHLYYMAMKTENWDFLRRYLCAFRDSYLAGSESPENQFQKDKLQKAAQEQADLLSHLDSGDFDFFRNMVKTNEEKMIEYIKQTHPTLYKTFHK